MQLLPHYTEVLLQGCQLVSPGMPADESMPCTSRLLLTLLRFQNTLLICLANHVRKDLKWRDED